MKKILAIVLALAMVLTITAACGKKEEPTEAPTTAAPTTEAPTTAAPTTPAPTTEAPTTPAPTTEAPTTEAPTTEAPTTEAPTTEAPAPVGSAQEVVDAALANLEAVLRTVGDESQATQVTFTGSGTAGVTISISMGEQSMDIPVTASGSASGVLDTGKGAHMSANYTADLGMLAMMLGGDSDSTEPIEGTVEAYADFASKKLYEKEDDVWYYSESGDIEFPLDEDEHLAGKMNLDEMFESYDFTTEGGEYVIEGILKMEMPEGTESLLPEDITAITSTLPLEDVRLSARITINKDLQFTGMKVAMGEFTMDLSELMEGFVVKMEGIELNIALDWGTGTYELPKEVEESAIEKPEEPGYEDDDYPWATCVFTLKDEELADTDEFSLKAESVKVNEFGEVIVKFDAENKLDKSLTFRFDDVAVNGFITSTYCSEEVEANKAGDFEMTIYPGSLSMIGAETVDQITFLLKVYDTDDYFSDGYVNEAYTLYPTGMDPEAYVAPERRTAETEVVVLDNDDVTVVVMECSFETYFGYNVVTYYENKTDKDLSFEFEDVKLNGKELEDAYWSVDVPAGGRCFDSKYFFDSTLEELEIDKVESISAVLNVEEDDFFSDEILFTADMLFEVK